MLFVAKRDDVSSTSTVSGLIDSRLAIEPVQQMQRAVLGHQSVYGHLGTGRSAGLILWYYVTSGEPATEQRDAIATRDVGERGPNAPPMNEERHGLAADVDIDALALELKTGEFTGLRVFARYFDGDVFGHLTPPAWFQNGGSQRQPLGRY